MALVPGAFAEGVTVAPDGDGVVRCRIGGVAAALVQVDEGLWLDVAALAARWPAWSTELVAHAGPEAPALLGGETVLERSAARLKDLILEHPIRAEHLCLLGEPGARRRAPDGDGDVSVSFALPRGELALRASRTSVDAAARGASAVDPAEVRFGGETLALPAWDALPWTDRDLVELAASASTSAATAPAAVLAMLEAALPDRGASLPTTVAVGTLMNVWGVVLRQAERLDDAVRMLARAREIGAATDPRLEQEATYNLGYAKLQRTMSRRTAVGTRDGVGLFQAAYDVDPRHRATWKECLALFERAHALDPADRVASAQVEQVRTLLAALDAPGGPPGGKAPSANAPRGKAPGGSAPGASAPPSTSPVPARLGPRLVPTAPPTRAAGRSKRQDDRTPPPAEWVMPALIAVVITVGTLAFLFSMGRESSAPAPALPPSYATPHVERPRAADDHERLAALASVDDLPSPTDAPCPVTVERPTPVARGEVIAPQLGRGIGTGELFGTEYFDATIRQWAAAHAPSLDVRPLDPAGVGPLTGADGPRSWFPRRDAHALTLLVRTFVDPTVTGDGSAVVPGHLEGRLLVWSYEQSRFVCTAEVAVDNGPHLTIVRSPDRLGDEDDPLNRARLDLVEQAVTHGIARLVATREGGDSTSPALPTPAVEPSGSPRTTRP